MSGDGQGLGEKVSEILSTGYEDNAELALIDAIKQPMEPHVQRFSHLWTYGSIGQADGDLVVAKNHGRGLGVTEVREDCPLVHGDGRCREEAAVFGLRDKGARQGWEQSRGGHWVKKSRRQRAKVRLELEPKGRQEEITYFLQQGTILRLLSFYRTVASINLATFQPFALLYPLHGISTQVIKSLFFYHLRSSSMSLTSHNLISTLVLSNITWSISYYAQIRINQEKDCRGSSSSSSSSQ